MQSSAKTDIALQEKNFIAAAHRIAGHVTEARKAGAPKSLVDEWASKTTLEWLPLATIDPSTPMPEIDLSQYAISIPFPQADPDIVPIKGEALPIITADVLPDFARDYVRALAASSEVEETMGTLISLAVLASTVQHRFRVETQDRHTEALTIFAAPSMESGERKTSTLNPLVAPLKDAERELAKERYERQIEINAARKFADKKKQRLYNETATTPEGEKLILEQIAAIDKAMPAELGNRQLVVQDFTESALATAMASNEESLFCASDEGGLFDNLAGRFSDTSEIDLVLKAHGGSPWTSNRTGRGITSLNRPYMSIAISPQPGIIAALGKNPQFSYKGLNARFLWALPKSRVGSRKLAPKPFPEEIEDCYTSSVYRLAIDSRKNDDMTTIKLSPEAFTAWHRFEMELEPRMAPGANLYRIKPWASKLPGTIARISAIVHLTSNPGSYVTPGPVPLEIMQRAIRVGRDLIPHAVAVHNLISSEGPSSAALVVDRFNAIGWPAGVQPLTNWWRPVRDIAGQTSKSFEPIADELRDHGFLIEDEKRGNGRRFRANRALRNIAKAA